MITYRQTTHDHGGFFHAYPFEIGEAWAMEVFVDGEKVLIHKPLPIAMDSACLCRLHIEKYELHEQITEYPRNGHVYHVKECGFGQRFWLTEVANEEYRRLNPHLKVYLRTQF